MDFRTLDLLFKCGKEFRHKRIRDCGLSETELMICSYIYSHADCSQDDVVRGLRIDKTTAAKAIQALESKNFVLRMQNKSDRRRKNLQLTDAGTARIASILDLHDRWLCGVLSCLSVEERTQFESYCYRLLCAAERMLSDQKEDQGENA